MEPLPIWTHSENSVEVLKIQFQSHLNWIHLQSERSPATVVDAANYILIGAPQHHCCLFFVICFLAFCRIVPPFCLPTRQWRVRKEAMMGLASIYKKYSLQGEGGREASKQISWIKDKLLHIYYQNSIDDRFVFLVAALKNARKAEPPTWISIACLPPGAGDVLTQRRLHSLLKDADQGRWIEWCCLVDAWISLHCLCLPG